MTHYRLSATLLAYALCSTSIFAQGSRTPYVGYLYPSGGQRGKSFQIVAGGRNLRGMKTVHVSGKGVTVTVEKYVKPTNNNDRREQTKEAKKRLKEEMNNKRGDGAAAAEALELISASEEMGILEWSHNPYYADFSKMTIHELRQVAPKYGLAMKQPNRQLADVLVLKVTVAAGATPGYRELRLFGGSAVANPVRFHVGTLPEYREIEPNDPEVKTRTLVSLPSLINGQIMPGDVDRFRIHGKQGQTLVMDMRARQLIPFLADAVPGWFQATLAVYDETGNEVAYADDYLFHPDPVLFFEVPKTGDYLVEVKDAIFRGREDFVYRLRIGELPFVTGMFPISAKRGKATGVELMGVNLPAEKMSTNIKPTHKPDVLRLWKNEICTNAMRYYSSSLPSVLEAEPNDTQKAAQPITLPHMVNGRIHKPGDVDVFSIRGKKGDTIVAEIMARRMGSPLDSLVQLTDSAGKVIQWNDDFAMRNLGDLTHQADSFVMAELPLDGRYYIRVKDTQAKGSPAHAYALRLSTPMPSATVYVNPSGISVPAGKTVPIQATVIRRDGFAGPVSISLAKDDGFVLTGTSIPAGVDRVFMTLTAPSLPRPKLQTIEFNATVIVSDTLVTTPCIPADDVMQAFLYRHLVDTKKNQVIVGNIGRGLPSYQLAGRKSILLAPGRVLKLKATPLRPVKNGTVTLSLYNPPKGVALQEQSFTSNAITFSIVVDGEATLAPGNLIIQAVGQFSVPDRKKKRTKDKGTDKAQKKTRIWTVPLGALPAIPFAASNK